MNESACRIRGTVITICENASARAYPVICAVIAGAPVLPARIVDLLHVIKLLVLRRDLCNPTRRNFSRRARQESRIRCARYRRHLTKVRSTRRL